MLFPNKLCAFCNKFAVRYQRVNPFVMSAGRDVIITIHLTSSINGLPTMQANVDVSAGCKQALLRWSCRVLGYS